MNELITTSGIPCNQLAAAIQQLRDCGCRDAYEVSRALDFMLKDKFGMPTFDDLLTHTVSPKEDYDET